MFSHYFFLMFRPNSSSSSSNPGICTSSISSGSGLPRAVLASSGSKQSWLKEGTYRYHRSLSSSLRFNVSNGNPISAALGQGNPECLAEFGSGSLALSQPNPTGQVQMSRIGPVQLKQTGSDQVGIKKVATSQLIQTRPVKKKSCHFYSMRYSGHTGPPNKNSFAYVHSSLRSLQIGEALPTQVADPRRNRLEKTLTHS